MEEKLYRSAWTFKTPGTRVDREKGIIYNAAVVTVGPAEGHGVHLEQEFVDETVKQGNERKNGVKLRYGHPTMSGSAIGSFLGRAKNFRVEGETARADLFLSREAKNSPQGDLYEYVLGMAENESEAFGLSIVFRPGKTYRRTEDGEKVTRGDDGYKAAPPQDYATMKTLFGADFVDDPAANPDGLFSSAFSSCTFAGRVSEFLDLNPEIFELLEAKPEIMAGFMARYKEYRAARGGSFDASEFTEMGKSVDGPGKTPVGDETNNEVNEMSERDQFQAMREEFGNDIASEVFANGGGMDEARALFESRKLSSLTEELEALKAENEALKAGIAERDEKLSAVVEGEAGAVEFEANDAELEEEPEPVNIPNVIEGYESEGLSSVEAQDKALQEYPAEFKKFYNAIGGK